MQRPIRAAMSLLIVTLGVASTSCSDSTGERQDLEIRVSPDTIRIDDSTGNVRVPYSMRNQAGIELLATSEPELQSETYPGSWSTLVGKNVYIQSSLGVPLHIPPGAAIDRSEDYRLDPGRYRLRFTYGASSSKDVTAPVTSIEALSNAHTVFR